MVQADKMAETKFYTLVICIGEDASSEFDLWLIPNEDIGASSVLQKKLDKSEKTRVMQFTPDDDYIFEGGELKDGQVITRIVKTWYEY